ncbi:hypothetical protein BT63DRAFT_460373 [Microthyrium microscopicum]|uniref:Uncharacterized protein n=1 Tax=Microthyrium microscopicum TaxID=703497 RepID=A0A6A6TYL0_9PEZI|nr:hypothetical protein BT63DRAFT_460373 [Microthyrium microscopicum]
MKVQSLILGAPLAAQAATIQKRQDIGGLISGAAGLLTTQMKPFKIVDGTSTMKRPGVKNIRIFHGPLNLLPADEAAKAKGFRSDPNSNSFMASLLGFPQDSYILRTNSSLQYEDGTYATVGNDVYNHHVQLFDIGKMNDLLFQCGKIDPAKPKYNIKIPGSYFGGSAADGTQPALFTSPDGTFNSGYFLGKNSKVMLSAELVNYSKKPKVIYHVTEVDYLPGDTKDIMDTSVGIMSVNQCDDIPNPFLSAPAGKKAFEMKSKQITILKDGYMIQRRGHMHDGGTGMLLKVNGKLACDSKAQYGAQGMFKTHDGKEYPALSGMHECNDPIEVKKGDSIEIEASFDLDMHPPRVHAGHGGGEAEEMALMGYVFAFKRPDNKQ